MAAIPALFMAWLSDCYLISMCVMVFVRGLATPAPRAGLPLIYEPSVYTKSLRLYFR
jgi:hypothetical protein